LKYVSTKILSVICGLMLILSLFITSIFTECFNSNLYETLYKGLNRAEEIGISLDDLMMVNANLLDYIQDKRKTLDMTAEINGQVREVFNDKEKEHMIDVKQLYLDGKQVRDILLYASLVLIAVMFIIRKKMAIRMVASGYLSASYIFLVVIILIGAYALLQFNQFWIQFHQLLFTNDLWLLDPKTDIIIQMVPSEFFFALIKAILKTFVSWFAASMFAAWLFKRFGKLAML